MAGSDFLTRLTVLALIAVVMTVGVYGLVAGIVKLDDLGLYLSRKAGAAKAIGATILKAAPWLMKGLSVAGTVAMFLVGGGILVHGFAPLRHAVEGLADGASPMLVSTALNVLVGLVAGAIVLGVVTLVQRLLRRGRPAAA